MWQQVEVSAPGNLMLMGEHAVLHGQRALVLAVDQRVQVKAQLLPQPELQIHSQLGHYQQPLSQLQPDPSFRFILAAVQQRQLQHGVALHIHSDFSHQVGLGSSAAVTLACLQALAVLQGQELSPPQLLREAHQVVLQVQGRGSGSDLAASCYGGLLAYQPLGYQVEFLPLDCPLSLWYAGYKTPTPQVIEWVRQTHQSHPQWLKQLYELMGSTTELAVQACLQQDWCALGHYMNHQHGLLDTLGVCDATLAAMVYRLRGLSGVLGAKISGSGLGDSVLAIGAEHRSAEYLSIPVRLSQKGVSVDDCY